MKRALSLLLMLAICLSLCACGKEDRYQKAQALREEGNYEEALKIFNKLGDYEDSENLARRCEAALALSAPFDDADTLVATLIEYYSGQTDIIKANTTIHKFFEQENNGVQMYHKLQGGIYMEDIATLYEMCNKGTWYYSIDTGWGPLASYSSSKPTLSRIKHDIKDEFIDPQSVSVEKGRWAVISESVDGMYEYPIEYVAVVTVRGTNAFGAYMEEEYLVRGAIPGEATLKYEYDGTNDDEYIDYWEDRYKCSVLPKY